MRESVALLRGTNAGGLVSHSIVYMVSRVGVSELSAVPALWGPNFEALRMGGSLEVGMCGGL